MRSRGQFIFNRQHAVSLERAVLTAYRAGWAASEQALADANPEAPGLPATVVDPELQQVKANLLADQRQGMVGRGTTTLHPKITALSGTSATVVDCAYSTAELVYEATGKPVPPVTPPENDGVTSSWCCGGDVEGLQADRDGREMRARLVTVGAVCVAVVASALLDTAPAWADDPNGQ